MSRRWCELEYSLGTVSVIEAGCLVLDELYEADDREAMLARYAELGGK